MVKEIRFVTIYDWDCRKRHIHYRIKDRITRFIVQLEILIDKQWFPIVRYDTAHGFAHRDIIHPNGHTDKTPLIFEDFNEALDFAEFDLKSNWEVYRERFLKEVKNESTGIFQKE